MTGAFPAASAALLAASLAAYAWPGAFEALCYDRAAVAAGGWHRLLTAHLTHANARHLFWNLVVWTALAPHAERALGRRFFPGVAGLAAALGLLVHLFQPALDVYCGLSGLASAAFGFALLRPDALRTRLPPRLLLAAGALFAAKLAFELHSGRSLFSHEPGSVPVPLVHLAGFLAGAGAGLRTRERPRA